MYCYYSHLGGFKGSAAKGRFLKCGLTVAFQIMTNNKNKASVCNKALKSTKNTF